MQFGGEEISQERMEVLGEFLRKPDFQNFINEVLDRAAKFPIEKTNFLEDRLWEVWTAWRKTQKLPPRAEWLGFHARIILGLLAILVSSAEEDAAALGKTLGLLFDALGVKPAL